MFKRFLAAVLCLCLMLALLPAAALAADDAADLQSAIDGAYATGLLKIERTYQGLGNASVLITNALILDLNGYKINDITLNIGNLTAAPSVTIKDSGGGGQVNCHEYDNAVNVDNGSLTVESGRISGAPTSRSGIRIKSGSVTILSGQITGHTGIDYQGGSLTFDCAVGKTASIIGIAVSLTVRSGKSVTVNDDTRVKVGINETAAAALIGDVVGAITLDRRPAPPSITAPNPLTEKMSNTPAYSGEFILAGDPPPIVNNIKVTYNGTIFQNTPTPATDYEFSWDEPTGRVKVLTGKLNPGVYTVTVEDTVNKVKCDWPMTIEPFVVPVNADRLEVAPNRYIIEPGESINLTADTHNVIQGGYIMWNVFDFDNNLLKEEIGGSLTYTPTQNVRCIPYVMRDKLIPPRSHIVLDSIEVFLRINVTQGANSRWLRDSADGLRFATTGKEAEFFGIYVGNVEIPRNSSYGKYNISSDPVSGGTILTLLPSFLATLPDGPHTLTFQYNNRKNTASTVFYVGNGTPGGDADSEADVPKTGDGTPLALLCGLILFSSAGLAASAVARRRKRVA